MGAKFTEKETEALRISMIQRGFRLLKEGGIRAVNIEEITRSCYVAKGTFYNLFKTKAEFLYQVMIFKRQESKNKIQDFLEEQGKLSRKGLNAYLHWLADEDPNIFSYLDEQHIRWLISKWPSEYMENEGNDKKTAFHIISFLAAPKEAPDWQLFCNYLKLIAMALNGKQYLIPDATETLIDNLINDACSCISY
ncbi:MAG: TetR/AcrR family transcriptional regulator [Ruminococcus sp.]|nr:TetR/AcrR family transcriptional regulator [Ruminococcus sp.]